MGKADSSKCVFPLTSLQIGDLQSYLSDLNLFIAFESRKLYILVDNRPWLRNLGSHPAHLWQLMVTKSRLSPFANTKAKRGRKEGNVASSQSNPSKSKKFERWFSLIEVATLSRKKGLPPVNKLRNSLLLSSELHRTLYGFIVFEVAWKDVRGINYLNELQTDTSLAIEAKTMRRWEFDSIAQAASCSSSWFSGTLSDLLKLKDFLDSAIGDTFYDTEENFPMTSSFDDDEDDNMWVQDNSSYCLGGSFDACPGTLDDTASEPHTPPPTGPYKRRRVIKSIGTGVEVDCYTEETQGGHEDLIDSSDTDASDCENAIEAKQYRDVLILFRFNDHDLPFKLREVVLSDLRLLTLLEAGLPSWVIFLQSYPGFCHLYRPWMCPLARALYVLISFVTVLIGFYDLYKNVPVLKATASSLCGPLFDWIETWEMVSRIKYLGTMLFLHNFEKAVTWFLMVTRTTRSFFSVFTQPLVEPLAEILGFLLPAWNMFIEVADSLYSFVWVVIESSSSVLGDLIEIFAWPLWFIWSIAISIIYPIFWIVWEILYAPIRLVLSLAGFVAFTCTWISEMIGDIWQSVSGIFQLASVSEATVSTYEVSVWRSLWNDLFSQVFRAVRSILNGFVAFFTACNRHRLSIYNHMQDFIQRLLGQAPRSQPSDYRNSRVTPETRSLLVSCHNAF
ncbi:G1/S-SPECIFIC CYCLIN-E PROTEIN [Salix viminalis]|uniref:G1/S-SPECIFIC CYCLIN-E PROTEIN n=1 Tax=Salix viminalis TaxID=40686 RepID=A0A9Q0NRP1_SALVM|nr:G1/S-SPECIFIC CYCLIN-E PROTEIN [Salix viminalis]